MKLIPLRDYVLIEPLMNPNQESTGILIPESADVPPPNIGFIRALPKSVSSPFFMNPLVEGDKVLFRSELFEPVGFEGKELLYGKQDQVIAVVED